jgi:type I restriction enzyme S subunit
MRSIALEQLVTKKKFAIVDGPFGSSLKTSDYVEFGVPVLQGKNITGDKFSFADIRYITQSKANDLARSKVVLGDILLVKIGSIGYAAQIDDLNGHEYAIIPANLAKVSLDTSIIYPKYFLQTFKQKNIKQKLQQMASKTAQPALSLQKIKQFQIPLPETLDDQIRIATVLTRAEKLIAKRKESIKALDELLKSTFQELFGNPVRNERGWLLSPLGEKLSVKHGFAFQGEYFSDTGEYVLLTPGNFFEEGGYRDRGDKQKYYQGEIPQGYLLNKGDLLIAMTEQAAGLLGSSIIVPDSNKFLHNQRLGLIILKKNDLNKLYLFHLFNHHNIRKLIHSKATGTKVRHTSPSKIEEIKVSLPPLPLQNQFAAIVEKVESIKSKYTQSLTKLEHLYGSLSQRAFKGELDLSKVPVACEIETEVGEFNLTGSTDMELKAKLNFSDRDLAELIKKYYGKIFSFDELWKEIEIITDKKIPSKNDIQTQIIELLESDKTNFEQVFDFLTSQTGKNDIEKQIAFRGNYEN